MFSCANISKPTPPAPVPDDQRTRSRKLKVTGRLKVAIDAMAWEGLRLKDAAAKAGLTYHALYSALRKPHVKAEYLAQIEMLRTSERARNIHRLTEIRDAGNNMPAVQAIGMLERMSDANSSSGSSGSASMPGVTIHIHAAPAADPQPAIVRHIDANPLISLDRDSLHENVTP